MMICSQGSRKGQYFSFDAIVASVIFVLTLVMLLSYWHSVRVYLDYQSNDISKEAARISDALFTPATGDCSAGNATLAQLGLASSWSDKRINQSILLGCNGRLSSADMQAALGASYPVSVVVIDTFDGTQYLFGDNPAVFGSGATEVSKMRRIGTIAGYDSSRNATTEHMATVDVFVYR